MTSRIIKRFKQSETLRKITANMFYLVADKFLRLGVGLVVGVWVARYLGPEDYGLWNYALAFTALFSAFASLGLDAIVVREIVKTPEKKGMILGTAFYLKLLAGFATCACTTSISFLLQEKDSTITLLVFLSSVGFIFQSINVIDLFFQAKILSKFVVYAQNISFILISAVKILLILHSAGLFAFALAGATEIILTAFFLIYYFLQRGEKITNWCFNRDIAANMLKDSWPLAFSFFSYVIYTRIDQVIIGNLLCPESVGYYSAAYKISEIPFLFIGALAQSLNPAMMRIYFEDKVKYMRFYELASAIATLTGYIIFTAVFFAGENIVLMLYGKAYTQSGQILIILSAGQIFMFNAFFRSSHLTIANSQFVLLISTIVAAFLNTILNFIFIPSHGIAGAALTTVFTQAVSLFFLNAFFSSSRVVFMVQLKGFLTLPILHFFRRTKINT